MGDELTQSPQPIKWNLERFALAIWSMPATWTMATGGGVKVERAREVGVSRPVACFFEGFDHGGVVSGTLRLSCEVHPYFAA